MNIYQKKEKKKKSREQTMEKTYQFKIIENKKLIGLYVRKLK